MKSIEEIALSKYPGDNDIAIAQRAVFIETIKSNEINTDIYDHEFTPITESEFKELFKLDEKCKISETSLFLYSKTVVGCYLLADEIFKNNIKIAEIPYKNTLVAIETDIDREWGAADWRSRVQDISSEPKMSVTFRYIDNDRQINFWSCKISGDTELQTLMSESYSKCRSYIDITNSKYRNKYGVSIDYRLDKYHPNNWFYRMDGIKFETSIPYTNTNGERMLISKYDIRSSIIQQSNIWIGQLPECLSKLIKSIK